MAIRIFILIYFCLSNAKFIFGESRTGFYFLASFPLIFFCGRILFKRPPSDQERLYFNLFLAYLFLIVLTGFFLNSEEMSFDSIHIRLICSIVISLLLSIVIPRLQIHMYFFNLLMVGGNLIASSAIYRYLHNPFEFVLNRGVSFSDPNYMGIAIAISVVVAFGQLISFTLKPVVNTLMIFITVIGLSSILMLSSRGATLAVLGSILSMLLVASILTHNKKNIFKFLFVSIVIALVCLMAIYNYNFIDSSALMSRFSHGDESISERLLALKAATKIVNELPAINLLFGSGSGMGMNLIGNQVGLSQLDAHNSFVTIFLDHGLFGLMIFLSILFISFKSIIMSKSDLAIIMVGVWTCLAVSSFTLSSFSQEYIWLAFAGVFYLRGGAQNEFAKTYYCNGT